MTEVAFHFNAPDKLGYACRLLRKAYLRGARVMVLVEERERAALDVALWTMANGEFIPHSGPMDPAHVKSRSPIHLASEVSAANGATVLVNLRLGMPAGYEGFARVIEVVTGDQEDRGHARDRWKLYKAQGIEPQRHDLQLAPQD
ncbi:DNA polymerase III subunit chi [Hydrogenophaga sp. UC242_50]|jgi:DNA polymerase-3 subunit chi|uniref:DNA polymerase III subunit chi n=1 Tax=unclassified Hydrogenophaga TaxID=2610897 RepID=UPI0036D2F536